MPLYLPSLDIKYGFVPTHIIIMHCSITRCRLAGDAGIFDSSSSGGTQFLCTYIEGQLGRSGYMPSYWLLLATRAHSSLWRVQKFIHSKQWNIQHFWYCSLVSLSCLGVGSPFHLAWSCLCFATGNKTFPC